MHCFSEASGAVFVFGWVHRCGSRNCISGIQELLGSVCTTNTCIKTMIWKQNSSAWMQRLDVAKRWPVIGPPPSCVFEARILEEIFWRCEMFQPAEVFLKHAQQRVFASGQSSCEFTPLTASRFPFLSQHRPHPAFPRQRVTADLHMFFK